MGRVTGSEVTKLDLSESKELPDSATIAKFRVMQPVPQFAVRQIPSRLIL
jgi:hypothetical protein